ncbi:MAG: transketolase [Bacillota bacterium]
MDYNEQSLPEIAKELRRKIFRMILQGGGGHIGGSFSIVEILTALYFGGVMRYDHRNPDLPERDRFILSKGHASAALYAVLAQAGFFEENLLDTFVQPGSTLGGHPNVHEVTGVEASTGALGHGLSYAAGVALAGKLDQKDYRVFVLLGDGECQEGSVWEAALFAAHQRLGNLTAIVDYNKLQAMDRLDNIIQMEPLADKWSAFGWEVTEVDGHNIYALADILGQDVVEDGPPRLIIAHTLKGKGVSFMENAPLWHYRLPNQEEMRIVIEELGLITEEKEQA